MEVTKRDGSRESVKFDKISNRIKKLTFGLNTDYVDYFEVAKKVISGLYDGVTTQELDKLASETAASMISVHPDYSYLASRIEITSLYKNTHKEFSKTAKDLYEYVNPKTNEKAGLISDDVYDVILKHGKELDNMVIHDRDFNFDFFGFKTLERAYLLKLNGVIAESPQHMLLRVSVGLWRDNLEMVKKTYDMMSEGLFTHATPTLFNSGTKRPQLSSCFLLDIDDDSITGIYKTLADCAVISQNAGGIGVNIHKIRSKGGYIKGTNGTSNGIIPMLRVFNETARYVDQCFASDTLIMTNSGSKKISDISVTDKVLTSDGEYKKVNKVKEFSERERSVVNIITNNGINVVTDKHLYLVVKNGKGVDNLREKIHLGVISVEWVEASNITTNDILLSKRN